MNDMDSVSLIVAALAAGALKGAGETASTAIADAYRGLKGVLTRRFAGNPRAELVVAEHANDPQTWEAPMAAVVRDCGADRDDDVLAAARKLLELTDPAGARIGKYVVDARGSNIGAVGDHAHQSNVFGAPPTGN
ncbi:hypothetical protein [Nocardia yunnanensis]|uniref:hypothetical protein n=1 Tax=Nocardia yunnanensis TaxID=2382165 RepID=UPI0013C4DAF3|nr:hypothetical protein [Nocardia yunnanensis]